MTTNYESDFQGPQITLPNSTLILVLGILSIPTCCCYGVLGIVCSIIALVLAKTATSLYRQDPARYTKSSYSNVNAGKVCAIIGLALSAIVILTYIYVIVSFGWAAFTDPSILYDHYGIEMPY